MRPSLHRIVLSLAVVLLCAAGSVGSAEAQRGASSKATASKGAPAGSETDRSLDGAAKSLAAGNADAAMTALDGILTGGGLSNTHMARALYLRGLAHRKKGRPAQAIADLTSAIWLKDGLSETDRAAALTARSEVSREVGVAAPAGGGSGTAASGSAPATNITTTSEAAPRTRTAAAPRSMADDLSEAGFTRSFTAPAPTAPAPAPEPPAAHEAARGHRGAPETGAATSSWQSTTTVDAKERRRPAEPRTRVSAAAPAAAPPSSPAADPPASGGGLGSFFSGLFSGTPSTGAAPSGEAGDRSAWKPPRTERWATTARPADAKAGRDAAPISTSAVPSGAFRLQIATVRSRKEAEAVAVRVRKEYASALGGRRLEVDETVFGSMGTFYRVRLGPYADVKEPKALCDQLRPKGYDCLVVTN